jgi:fluoride exporter
MKSLLLVATGGAAGAVARYLAGLAVYRWVPAERFPLATLVVNVLGCFAIGFLNDWPATRATGSPELRLLLVVGFLGAFTTYSAFGAETVLLARGGETVKALVNVGVHLAAGLGAVILGSLAAREW